MELLVKKRQGLQSLKRLLWYDFFRVELNLLYTIVINTLYLITSSGVMSIWRV